MEKDKKSILKFNEKVREITKEVGQLYYFKCPICGGDAIAQKSTYNGHKTASCEKCGMLMME